MASQIYIVIRSIAVNTLYVLQGIIRIRNLCLSPQNIYQFVRVFHLSIISHSSNSVHTGGAQEEKYSLIDISKVGEGGLPSILEEVEISRAQYEVYEGAVVCLYICYSI